MAHSIPLPPCLLAGRGFRVGILACFLFQGLGGDSGTRGELVDADGKFWVMNFVSGNESTKFCGEG